MARPVTDRQWQDAVDAAHLIMTLEVGHIFELIGEMPAVDFERISQTLEEGRERGITPMADIAELQDAAAALVEKIEQKLPTFTSGIINEIERLREALKQRRKKELYCYSQRKAS